MTTQTTATGIRPTHRIYHVIGTGRKSKWTEIGAAWPNKDAKGFSIACQAMPLDGRIVMREAKSRADTDA